MKARFDLQFFGGGGSSSSQYRKRDPEPQELIDLRNKLVGKISPMIDMFDINDWEKAKDRANNALEQQGQMIAQIPEQNKRNQALLDEMMGVVRTGNVPSALIDNANASVNKGLKTGMGSMLDSLGTRGVLNSSITSRGINDLSQRAADAMNTNYLNAYNSVLNGYAQGLQGTANETNSLLSVINALGNIPSQQTSGATNMLMPGYNMWKDWQNMYYGHEDYDTVVKQGK
ncbi:MAG: hypothetical protein IJ667_04685 [Synergistaceae bacterium]|nr:hypothetical protein [Synergistaceae bacterium]